MTEEEDIALRLVGGCIALAIVVMFASGVIGLALAIVIRIVRGALS